MLRNLFLLVAVPVAVKGGASSTTALSGSTEEDHFNKNDVSHATE